MIGKDAARALILAVATLSGRTLGDVAEHVRSLPRFNQMQAQWAAEGLDGSVGAVAGGGHSGTVAIQHRGGNKQVVLSNGQRWHLPRGKSLNDIPAWDPLGDELQAAVKEMAAKWSEAELTDAEREAITDMRNRGDEHWANLLERQARGRWVERRVARRFPQLTWNERGVDVTGPNGQSYHYEILSGTESNFALHGRRMASTFFRMIFF